MADSTFTFRVDDELKAEFARAADAGERTAAQLLRVLMRNYVDGQHADERHDAWFRQQVQAAVADADDAATGLVAHADVAGDWQRQRAGFERRGAGRTA